MLTVKTERPRLISDLAPEVTQLIEDMTVDRKGRLITEALQQAAGKQGTACDAQYRRPHRMMFPCFPTPNSSSS
jgi:hypothetical protein